MPPQEFMPCSLGESFPLTDTGLAERFALQQGDAVRYCHPWAKYLCWDGKRWKIDDQGTVDQLAKQTVRSILHEAADSPDDAHLAGDTWEEFWPRGRRHAPLACWRPDPARRPKHRPGGRFTSVQPQRLRQSLCQRWQTDPGGRLLACRCQRLRRRPPALPVGRRRPDACGPTGSTRSPSPRRLAVAL